MWFPRCFSLDSSTAFAVFLRLPFLLWQNLQIPNVGTGGLWPWSESVCEISRNFNAAYPLSNEVVMYLAMIVASMMKAKEQRSNMSPLVL